MKIRRLTSMLMLFSSLVLIYTGVFLFISPPGRVANWALWSLGGLSKEQHASLHIVFVLLFLTSFVLHVFYNYKPILQYMKNKAQKLVVFTPETSVAFALCVLFGIGALVERGPLHAFLEWGDEISYAWEKQFGSAPYSHAELNNLAEFTRRMGYDLEASVQRLEARGIRVESPETTLAEIAGMNKMSPQAVFELMREAHEEGSGTESGPDGNTDGGTEAGPSAGPGTDGGLATGQLTATSTTIPPTTGLGRMTLQQLLENHGLDQETALEKLREQASEQAEITPNMLVRQVAATLEMTPEEILLLLTR